MSQPPTEQPSGLLELYVYWRLAPASSAEAAVALASWQADLRASCPGLQTRWLRRADSGREADTWMEIYAAPGGIDADMAQRIEHEGGTVLSRWCIGQRHIERFVTP